MRHLIFALLICAAAPAKAEFTTGNELHAQLAGNVDEQRIGTGYVMGVHDAGRSRIHCSPTGVTASQAVDMVKQFLVQYPAVRNKTADSLVLFVFSQAWPCAEKKQKPAVRGDV